MYWYAKSDVFDPGRWYQISGRDTCHFMVNGYSPLHRDCTGVCGCTSRYVPEKLLRVSELSKNRRPKKCEQCVARLVVRSEECVRDVAGDGLHGGMTIGQLKSQRKDYWLVRAWKRLNAGWREWADVCGR